MRRFLLAGCAVLALACGAVGCAKKSETAATSAAPAADANGPLTIAIAVDSTGFNPSEVKATAGKPVTLVFTRKTEQTCATSVVFPDLKITKDLPMNTPVEITFTPEKSGDINFACGMNMITGVVTVQ